MFGSLARKFGLLVVVPTSVLGLLLGGVFDVPLERPISRVRIPDPDLGSLLGLLASDLCFSPLGLGYLVGSLARKLGLLAGIPTIGLGLSLSELLGVPHE